MAWSTWWVDNVAKCATENEPKVYVAHNPLDLPVSESTRLDHGYIETSAHASSSSAMKADFWSAASFASSIAASLIPSSRAFLRLHVQRADGVRQQRTSRQHRSTIGRLARAQEV